MNYFYTNKNLSYYNNPFNYIGFGTRINVLILFISHVIKILCFNTIIKILVTLFTILNSVWWFKVKIDHIYSTSQIDKDIYKNLRQKVSGKK